MSAPLHQILAVERGISKTADREITNGYQLLQKPALMEGMARTYQPKDDDGDRLPSENQYVQLRSDDILDDIRKAFETLMDITAVRDFGNQSAVADVVVDGNVLISKAPAPYLLWLEKQLDHINTVVSKIPVLSPEHEWEWNDNVDAFSAQPVETQRTKKVPEVLVKAPATDKHPAQVEVFMKDVVDGYWTTVRFSGARPAGEVSNMSARVQAVRDAVRIARSRANETEVEHLKISAPLLNYIFG